MFTYTGGEQKFVVPPGYTAVDVVATGAPGGTPTNPPGASGGRGAVVSGTLSVKPNEVLYVEVGGVGGDHLGGFNGGGDGGTSLDGIPMFGGGGASDVRLTSSAASGSLASRLIVAGGGGGSGYGTGGGDAGAPGARGGCCGPTFPGGAGTQSAGGAGGCGPSQIGCGMDGSLGVGGEGGGSGFGYYAPRGGGGGGGLYGGGGGAGSPEGNGGGGGGSSLVPAANGSQTLAPLDTPPSVVVTATRATPGTNRQVPGTGSGPLTFDVASFTGTTNISGVMAQLGLFTSSMDFSLNFTGFSPPTSPFEITGTTTFVAANGDKLFGTVTGTGSLDSDGTSSGVNVVTITGGTGRFANATGTLAETYTVSAASVITVSIQGHISS